MALLPFSWKVDAILMSHSQETQHPQERFVSRAALHLGDACHNSHLIPARTVDLLARKVVDQLRKGAAAPLSSETSTATGTRF